MACSLLVAPLGSSFPRLRTNKTRLRTLGCLQSARSSKTSAQKRNFNPAALYVAAALGIGFGFLSHSHPEAAQAAIDAHNGRDLGDLAMGPEGPLLEEFWDNMRRYAIYFVTVATGGLYTILKPIFDLLSNPVTGILALIVIVGGLYLVYLTLSAMLGLTPTDYPY